MALLSLPVPALADVLECGLRPTSDTGLVGGMLRVYQFDGTIHSAFLQTRTDYGDDLPYVFFCEGRCVMDMVQDDYVYVLRVSPSLRSPRRVSLVTTSRREDFTAEDKFETQSCQRSRS